MSNDKLAAIDWNALIEAVPWFGQLSAPTRRWLMDNLEPISLTSGDTLFEAGSPPDALYILASGSLGAYATGDPPRYLGQIVAGETAGETGLITGRSARSAHVRALRDSEVLKLSRDAFESLSEREPEALRTIARLAIDRAAGLGKQRITAAPRTLAILPQTENLNILEAAHAMRATLERFGRVAIVDEKTGHGHDAAWFSRLESGNRFVLYVADSADPHWRSLCLRQADALVFLACARTTPAPWSELVAGISAPLPRPEHLILVHDDKPRLGAGRRWRQERMGAKLHHVRRPADYARVMRLITGRCVTLVLSGGGARGFAHIGVIRAIREAGIEIDAVAGTSIGGIIGAGVACDWSDDEMVENYRHAFVDTNPLSDRTIPFVSLFSGRKVSRLLKQAFGERDIEDLVLPFFCVSADLTVGEAAVHRYGPLWKWLRASVAIPGVLPPVFQNGRVFVDGGVINNLPVDLMREFQAGEVIAVDIGGDHTVWPGDGIDEFDLPPLWKMILQWYTGHRRPSILQIMLRSGMVNSSAATHAARRASTLLISPPLADIDLLDWKSFHRAIDIGYQHASRVLASQKEVLAQHARLTSI
jgi:NTE family protein